MTEKPANAAAAKPKRARKRVTSKPASTPAPKQEGKEIHEPGPDDRISPPDKEETKPETPKATATEKPKLRRPQLKVLEALKDGSSLTRKEVSTKAKVDNASLTGYIGSMNDDVRQKNDREFYPSLLTLSMVTAQTVDEGGKDVLRFSITKVGLEELEPDEPDSKPS